MKKIPSGRPYSSSQENQAPRENLILFPSLPLLPNFIVTTFIEDCFRSDAAADFLRRLPAFDVVVWTDGSVPFLLDAGGANVYAACRKCLSSSLLPYSAGPIFSGFSTKSLALTGTWLEMVSLPY